MPFMPIISHLLCSGSAGPQGCRLCCHCLVMSYFISLCAFCAIRLIVLPQRERIRITVFQCLLFHLWVLLKIHHRAGVPYSVDRLPVNASSCKHKLRLPAYHIKKPPVLRTSGSLSNLYADKSDYSGMRVRAPRFRYPLDPVAMRHAGINQSAFSAVGILVPWRSYGRYEIVMLSVFLFNIAFPFRICDPVLFIFRYYNMNCLLCHYTGGIKLWGFLEPISVFGLLSRIFWFPSRFLVPLTSLLSASYRASRKSGSTNFSYVDILSGILTK